MEDFFPLDEIITESYKFLTRNGEAVLQRMGGKDRNKKSVLFIHGFNSSQNIWFSYKSRDIIHQGFAEKALEDGYDVWTLSLSKPKMGNLIELAEDDVLTSIKMVYKSTSKKIVIVAHSMGGVLCRYLTQRKIGTKTQTKITQMVSEIYTLATPHQGFTIKQKFQNRLSNIIEKFENWVANKQRFPLYFGFFQFLSQNDLFKDLNSEIYLNPSIKWHNAIAQHDIFIHESSKLPENKLKNVDQREFKVHHFKMPFSDFLIDLIEKVRIKEKWISFYKKLYFIENPPIYWSDEVYKWIFSKESIN